jgi:NADH-quinone oxidoreductase subunit K
MIEGVSIQMILTFTTVLFFIGLYGFITRTNLIGILMSVELMLNAEAINFVVINMYLYPGKLEGGMFSLFILALAAAETALALAIILQVFKRTGSVDVKEVKELKY